MEDKDDEGLRFEKLKRERTKKLSILSTQSSSGGEIEMMNSAGSDGEEQLRPTMSISKRFKLPKKSVHDCNTVDHSSVPRKLRSAMKKRSSEPLSPPLSTRKKPNHGMNRVELAGKDTMKKSQENRVDDSEGSPSQSIAGPISKDEEEVVETLSALAEMFPANDNMKRVDGEVAKAKPSMLSGKDRSNPEVEAPGIGKDMKTACTLSTSVAANSIFSRGSTEGTFKDKCSNELLQTDLSSCSNLLKELDNTIFQRKAQVMSSLLSESEPVSGKPSSSHSQLSLREMQSKHLETSLCAGKPEIIVGQIAAFSRHKIDPKDSKKRAEGPVLWPGLSSSGSHSAGIQGPSFKSNNRKPPSWLGMSPDSTQLGSVDDGLAVVKGSGALVAGKKSWKRCSAHVYICRLIKVLEIGETTDRSCSLPNQSTPDIELSSLLAGNSQNGVRNDLNGDVSAHNMAGSSAENKNPHEVRNAILLQRRLFQDHQQASTSSALYTSQNKGFDFLSLSAGGGGLGIPNRNAEKSGNGLEPSTQFHNPYLQSLGHNSSIMPFYLPHNQFSLPPPTDHHPAAAAKQVRLQPKPYQYLGSRLLSMSHTSNTESHKQQQQQQRNWMAAQYKPMGLAPSHNPNLQNGRQDPTSAAQYAKFSPQLLHSSLEALGPKYAPFFQQNQHQHAATGPSSPATGPKRQYYLPPSGYEGTGVRPYSDCPLPLQLLCNEHL